MGIIADNYLVPMPKDFLFQCALMRMRAALSDPKPASYYGVFVTEDGRTAVPFTERSERLVKRIDDVCRQAAQKPGAKAEEYRAWLQGVFEENHALGVARADGLVSTGLHGMLALVDGDYDESDREDEARRVNALGAVLYLEEGRLRVADVNTHTPAGRAGLQNGDIVYKIDGKDTTGPTRGELLTALRGPVGSKVVLTVLPEGQEKPRQVEVVRDLEGTSSGSVHYKLVAADSKIGYMRFPSLDLAHLPEVDETAQEMVRQGMAGLIVDLRVGEITSFEAAAEVIDRLVGGDWTLTYEARKDVRKETRKARQGVVIPDVPLVVMVECDTSGPIEFVAAVLQETGRGLVLGVKTRGCPVAARAFPVAGSNYILRFNAAVCRTPKGVSLLENGVRPDIHVEMDDEVREQIFQRIQEEDFRQGGAAGEQKPDEVKDVQLHKAIEYLGGAAGEAKPKEGKR
jgi:carboxyl-terminal processing protease